jgi:glycosyltransferase involved in cell wall biosynthesis
MHICLVSQEYPPDTAFGGIGTQTWNKAWSLTELGHRVTVVSASRRPTEDTRSELVNGVEVRRIRTPNTNSSGHHPTAYWMAYSYEVSLEIQRLVKIGEVDVIDFAEYAAEGIHYILDHDEGSRRPVAVQLHGPLAMFSERVGWPESESDFCRLGTLLEEICIQRADALMACSANIADFTAVRHRVDRDSISVVHCGVDTNTFCPKGPRAESPTILFVGNVTPAKGILTLVNAALSLRKTHPDLVLQIAGATDEGVQRQILNLAEAAGMERQVQLLGFVAREDLPDLYRRAWVFASPAFHEPGVANVYLEAMACACPVVVANTGGGPEAVDPEVTGVLVPPNDVNALRDALSRIVGSSSTRDALGANGWLKAKSYFGMDQYVQRVLSVYERAISVARARY